MRNEVYFCIYAATHAHITQCQWQAVCNFALFPNHGLRPRLHAQRRERNKGEKNMSPIAYENAVGSFQFITIENCHATPSCHTCAINICIYTMPSSMHAILIQYAFFPRCYQFANACVSMMYSMNGKKMHTPTDRPTDIGWHTSQPNENFPKLDQLKNKLVSRAHVCVCV